MAKLIYRSLEALEPANRLLSEATEAVRDKARTIDTSSMSEVLAAAAGAGAGVAAGVGIIGAGAATGTAGAAALTSGLAAAGSVVGGGMMAGVFVAAAPVAILGVGAFAVVSRRNRTKLAQAKELLLQRAVVSRDTIIRELEATAAGQADRIEYLGALNIKLQEVIKNLQSDLAA